MFICILNFTKYNYSGVSIAKSILSMPKADEHDFCNLQSKILLALKQVRAPKSSWFFIYTTDLHPWLLKFHPIRGCTWVVTIFEYLFKIRINFIKKKDHFNLFCNNLLIANCGDDHRTTLNLLNLFNSLDPIYTVLIEVLPYSLYVITILTALLQMWSPPIGHPEAWFFMLKIVPSK